MRDAQTKGRTAHWSITTTWLTPLVQDPEQLKMAHCGTAQAMTAGNGMLQYSAVDDEPLGTAPAPSSRPHLWAREHLWCDFLKSAQGWSSARGGRRRLSADRLRLGCSCAQELVCSICGSCVLLLQMTGWGALQAEKVVAAAHWLHNNATAVVP
jgi:hypothetical protein